MRPPDPIRRLLVGLILAGLAQGPLAAQASSRGSVADIFFLDLGIVIEPVTGRESYSRLIQSPSEDVRIRIDKVKSGAVYMATSEEMLKSLDRINLRIAALEQSFQAEMNRLRRENAELRGILEDMSAGKSTPALAAVPAAQPAPVAEVSAGTPAAPPPLTPVKPSPAAPPAEKPRPKFDQARYMAGVFAYQREDYQNALDHFVGLALDGVNPRTTGNVLYWMADAHQQLSQYDRALALLEQVLTLPDSDRQDDALIQQGLLYRRLGREDQALGAFSQLVQEFPSSEYSRLAKMELKKAEMVP